MMISKQARTKSAVKFYGSKAQWSSISAGILRKVFEGPALTYDAKCSSVGSNWHVKHIWLASSSEVVDRCLQCHMRVLQMKAHRLKKHLFKVN
jgi:hypothetical protein